MVYLEAKLLRILKCGLSVSASWWRGAGSLGGIRAVEAHLVETINKTGSNYPGCREI